jgi:hypothetical protein
MMEWNIQTRARGCQSCQKPFSDGEVFHTLLVEEKTSFWRNDLCHQCWAAHFEQGVTGREGYISHWQGNYQSPPAGPPDPIQKETAETLLRKLVELNDPAHAAARYILAVMLERKRLLKVKAQVIEGGQRVFVYEHARTGDVFAIPDPDLQLDQLEAVQRDVARLLQEGINASGEEGGRPDPAPSNEQPEAEKSGETPEQVEGVEVAENKP